ncbi:MAG: Thioredoxin reductase [uncultured Solirubrobacteraceae bacterium]|uniref:Thioredoxin reductase n=1 Tax=uncultured Solirubrobacteraceae bacterium TaxID=1162706 RepID=A0A6J4S5J3_9ACTN|nr:MAG: Thioredoxin reductase [uncultured Solirubrobacteraceae bacterium]
MTGEAQAFWDGVYRRRDRPRHGEPHPYLRQVLSSVPPGHALELGCGDGTTAIWLAAHGWTVTAVDVSQVALDAATEHALSAGVASRITWQQADLRDWTTQESFDLVTAFFLHTPLEPDAPAVLARAAAAARNGGTLLTVGHHTLPPWAWDPDGTDGLLSASELVTALGVREPDWQTVLATELPRTVTGRDGHASTVLDAVLHAVRAS